LGLGAGAIESVASLTIQHLNLIHDRVIHSDMAFFRKPFLSIYLYLRLSLVFIGDFGKYIPEPVTHGGPQFLPLAKL
jgi:hypothetical protein